MLRWWTAAALVVAAGAALLPLASSAADGPKPPSALVFGARADAAPLSSRTNGKWTGYTIDLCNEIFKRYQIAYRADHPSAEEGALATPDYVPISAPERMDALVHGRIDVLCGATTVTIGRMKQTNFTLLTYVSGAGIMKKTATSPTLLKPGGKTPPRIVYVGCTPGMSFADCTTTEHWVKARFGSTVELVPRKSHTEAFQALRDGDADFYVGDRVILDHLLQTAKDSSDYMLAPNFLSFEPYAIPIAKGNDMLLHVADAALADLYRQGVQNKGGIDVIYKRYFNKEKSDLLRAMYRLQALPQ